MSKETKTLKVVEMRWTWVGITTFLVLLVLAGCKSTPSLEEAFSDENCESTCINGIVSGSTTDEELEAIFDDIGIEADLREIPGGEKIYCWNPLQDSTLSMISSQQVEYQVCANISPESGRVGLITVDLDVCASTIVQAFGTPDRLTTDLDGRVQIAYVERGLYFWAGYSDPIRVGAANIWSSEFLEEYLSEYGQDVLPLEEFEMRLEQECTDNLSSH